MTAYLTGVHPIWVMWRRRRRPAAAFPRRHARSAVDPRCEIVQMGVAVAVHCPHREGIAARTTSAPTISYVALARLSRVAKATWFSTAARPTSEPELAEYHR